MARNTPLYADIIGSELSTLHRHPREVVHEEESRNQDRMGATSGCLEPAKGTSFQGCSRPRRAVGYTHSGPFLRALGRIP
jgi:hypothetical protein